MSLIWGSGRNKNREKETRSNNSENKNIKAKSPQHEATRSDVNDSIDSSVFTHYSGNGNGNGNGFDAVPDIELTPASAQIREQSNIVDLSARRALPVSDTDHVDITSHSPVSGASSKACAASEHPGSADATILQFRGRSEYIAAIEIDDFLTLKMLYSDVDLQLLLDRMGYLLKREFGEQAVSRKQREFLIQFDDFELLVGGLLRAQFYAYKVDLPSHNIFGEVSDQPGLLLTWGIGRSDSEAHAELIKKKRYKAKRKRARRKRKPLEPV